MNIERLRRIGRWPLEKLADAIVYLGDFLLRFLDSRGWWPALKVKKERQNFRQNEDL